MFTLKLYSLFNFINNVFFFEDPKLPSKLKEKIEIIQKWFFIFSFAMVGLLIVVSIGFFAIQRLLSEEQAKKGKKFFKRLAITIIILALLPIIPGIITKLLPSSEAITFFSSSNLDLLSNGFSQ